MKCDDHGWSEQSNQNPHMHKSVGLMHSFTNSFTKRKHIK